MMQLSQEVIEKAKACKTPEELASLARENEYELSVEDANLFFQELTEKEFADKELAEGELADEELDNVAGGSGCTKPANPYPVLHWNTKEEVQFIFNIGDRVEAFAFGCQHHTATCIVTDRKAEEAYIYTGSNPNGTFAGYKDLYYLKKAPGTKSAFINDWCSRSEIEQ